MKILYKTLYHGATSLSTDYGSKIESTLSSLVQRCGLSSKTCDGFILVFDIHINPSKENTKEAFSYGNGLFVKTAQELEGDHDVFNLLTRISEIKAKGDDNNILIEIKLISQHSPSSSDEEAEQVPQYNSVQPLWSLSDTILPDDVVKRIKRASYIIKFRDVILDEFEYSRLDKTMKSIICLYGPAGTGKTRTAEGIASLLGKNILKSSYAQIESKYVGEGAKNLRALFKAAEEQDALLFLDEADSFLSRRIESTCSSSDKHYNRMSNELFQLLENHNGCVVFATNLLTDLDNAFKSRIIDSILIPLPDKDSRIRILKAMVPAKILDSVFNKDEDKLSNFAEYIDGFSGRDIRKSLLLTYADAAEQRFSNPDLFEWSYELFVKGFTDVKNSFSEHNIEIPIEEVQKFEDEQKLKEKQINIAKHAIISKDEEIDECEINLINDLSNKLIGKSVSREDLIPSLTLEETCANITYEEQLTLIDTAIRVIAIDGNYSNNEHVFVHKMLSIIGIPEETYSQYDNYIESLAKVNKMWTTIIS